MITPLGNSYNVQLLSPFGTVLDYVQILQLDYSRALGVVGQLTLMGTLTYEGEIDEYCLLKVFRGVGGDLATVLDLDQIWIITRVKLWLNSDGTRTIVATAKDALMLLDDRIVAYYAQTSGSDMTGLAGNLMKAVVRQNIASTANDYSGTANTAVGSLPARGISTQYFQVSGDNGEGVSLSIQFAWQKVLTALANIRAASAAQGSDVLFDIVAVGGTLLEFRTYNGIRGTDHTSTGNAVLLDPILNNLGETSLTIDAFDETTFIYCGGQNQSTDRTLKQAYDTGRINKSPFARRESFADARNSDDDASVQSAAWAALRAAKGKVVFESVILETPTNRYGIEYDFGAKLPVSFLGRKFNCTLDKIQVSVAAHKEKITAKLQGIL